MKKIKLFMRVIGAKITGVGKAAPPIQIIPIQDGLIRTWRMVTGNSYLPTETNIQGTSNEENEKEREP